MNHEKISLSKIVNGLVNDAMIFYSKSKTYRNYREIDGVLANLLLAANNLNKAIEIIGSELDYITKDSIKNEYSNLEKLPNESYDLTVCKDIRTCKGNLEQILKTILNETKQIQLELKSQKSSGRRASSTSGSSSGSSAPGNKDDNDDKVSCSEVDLI